MKLFFCQIYQDCTILTEINYLNIHGCFLFMILLFSSTTIHRILETDSSFHAK